MYPRESDQVGRCAPGSFTLLYSTLLATNCSLAPCWRLSTDPPLPHACGRRPTARADTISSAPFENASGPHPRQARELSTIRYFDGFLGARIGPVTTLSFHPQKVLLGVGAIDSVVSIYSA